MKLWDRIYLTCSYGRAQLVLGCVYNVACTALLAQGFFYSFFVDAFILKALFTAVTLYLVSHFRDPGAIFFYINLGLSRRRLVIGTILLDFLALAVMLTTVLLIHG